MDKYNSTEDQNGSFIDPRMFGLFKSAYSVKETLDQLSIGRTTFYELVDRGELKIVKLGKKSLVYAGDIAALLGKLRAASEKAVNRRPTLTPPQSDSKYWVQRKNWSFFKGLIGVQS